MLKPLVIVPIALVLLSGLCTATKYTDLSTEQTTFVLYYGADNSETFESPLLDEITNHPQFNSRNPTTLYIHGYIEDQTSGTVVSMVQAYAKRGNNNFIALNWAIGASGPLYPISVRYAYRIGRIVGAILFNAFNSGFLERKQLHIVGHSLGAQMAGLIGRSIIELPENINGIKLERISGLDPAGPSYFLRRPEYPLHLILSNTDAKMVDIIHSDRGVYGYPISTGTVDFYPNGGARYQPGCSGTIQLATDKDFCSHRRSVDFWVESVTHERNFDAIALTVSAEVNLLGWSKFKTNSFLDEQNIVPMGIACPATASGDYYLQTNNAAPFGRAADGTRYDSSVGIF